MGRTTASNPFYIRRNGIKSIPAFPVRKRSYNSALG
jgi:hypothetical protein